MNNLTTTWKDILGEEKEKEYFKNILSFIENERKQGKIIYPPNKDMFNAFSYTPFDKLKVVLIGQDPYHGPNQAHGLSFSVKEGIAFPPSLQNIFKELHDDIGCDIPKSGNLTKWATQGVLLLNSVLTVRKNQPNSHQGKGWEQITSKIIDLLNKREDPVIFLLWGSSAKKIGANIDRSKHYVLTAVHPSPMSANQGGWFGCKHFSKTNEILKSLGKTPIDWSLN